MYTVHYSRVIQYFVTLAVYKIKKIYACCKISVKSTVLFHCMWQFAE